MDAHGEFAHRHRRPARGRRGDDGVQSRAIPEPYVDHGRGLVESSPGGTDDAFDQVAQLLVRVEIHVRHRLFATIANGEDAQWTVDDDLLDTWIVHQWLQDA